MGAPPAPPTASTGRVLQPSTNYPPRVAPAATKPLLARSSFSGAGAGAGRGGSGARQSPWTHRTVQFPDPIVVRAPVGRCDRCDRLNRAHPTPVRAGSTATVSNRQDCALCCWKPVAMEATFASLGDYRASFRTALVQQLNMALAGVASRFFAALPANWESKPPAAGALRRTMRARGVKYYSNVNMTKSKLGNFGGMFDRDQPAAQQQVVYLQLDSTEVERSTEYAMGDLWVVSSSPTIVAPGRAPSRSHFSFVARSGFHGPTNQGRMQLLPLLPRDRWVTSPLRTTRGDVVFACGCFSLAALCRCVVWGSAFGSFPATGGKEHRVYAIRGPNAHGDVNMLNVLEDLSPLTVGFLPTLLKGAGADAAAKLSAARAGTRSILDSAAGGVGAAAGAGSGAAASSAVVVDDTPTSMTDDGTLPSIKLNPDDVFTLSMTADDLDAVVAATIKKFSLNGDQVCVVVVVV